MRYFHPYVFLFFVVISFASRASLFAAEENKEKESEAIKERRSYEKKLNALINSDKYEDQLTCELVGLVVDRDNHFPWDQEIVDRMQELIDAGANIKAFDDDLFSQIFLSAACLHNNISFIETCLTHGESVNGFLPDLGVPSLFFALSPGAAQLLLDARADVNFKKTLEDNDSDFVSVGSKALHAAAGSHDHPPEVVALLCDHTPAEPLSLDDLGRSPLYFLCLRAQYEKIDSFFKKARALIWWSPEQVDILDRERKQTPRDCLMRICRDLVKGFDAIVGDVKLARAQLLPYELTMSLKTFNQRPQQALKELIENQGLVSSIGDIILGYAGENTPLSLYPSLIYQEGDEASYLLSTVSRTPVFRPVIDEGKDVISADAIIDEEDFVMVGAVPNMLNVPSVQRKKTQKKNYFCRKRSSSKKCLIS